MALQKQFEATKLELAKKEEEKAKEEEDMCPTHKRKLELICIEDRARICTNCALFGQHKGHDVRMESEVVDEITVRTEVLI